MRKLKLLVASSLLAIATLPAAGSAQDTAGVAQRVDRIERELRAVQRRIFPGGQDGAFRPEVQPQDAQPQPGNAGTSPIADLSARIDAIEAQLQRLTEQSEQTEFRQREIQASITQLRTDLTSRIDGVDRRLAAADAANAAAATETTAATVTPTVAAPTRTTPPPAAPRNPPTRPVSETPAPAPAENAAAIAARRARVAAIEVPATGNAAEDAYLYGYRLWEARLFPEAQAQLRRVIETYPTHRRASFAGNLLGRALLDNNQPTLAVGAFYDNYRIRPRGERAPDSVYYMGMALIRLDRRTDACRTFDEFTSVYGATASEALKAQVATARGQAGC